MASSSSSSFMDYHAFGKERIGALPPPTDEECGSHFSIGCAIVPSVPFNYQHCLDRCKQLPMKMMKYNLVALPPLKRFQLTLYLITCSLYVNVRENDGYILFIHLC